jgi:ATP-dependent DNA helicase RecG
MPSGRKPVITKIVRKGQEDVMYDHVREELKAGRQAYVICPRIDEPDPEKETAIRKISDRRGKATQGESSKTSASPSSTVR